VSLVKRTLFAAAQRPQQEAALGATPPRQRSSRTSNATLNQATAMSTGAAASSTHARSRQQRTHFSAPLRAKHRARADARP
jgi:hypothetical protein